MRRRASGRAARRGVLLVTSDEARRPAIVTEGGLPPLISLACSDDVSDMKAATATLRGLSAAPEARRQVVLGTNWTFEHWNKSLVGASLASTSW